MSYKNDILPSFDRPSTVAAGKSLFGLGKGCCVSV